MKRKLTFALTAIFALCFVHQQAQVSSYSFTQTLGSYGAPNNGTMVGNNMMDDDVNTAALPFPFVYNGVTYNTVDVCANGFLCFVTGTITGNEYNPISDNSTQNIIAPFGRDLITGTFIMADLTVGSNTLTNCSSVNGYSVGDVFFDYGFDFGGSNPTVTAIVGNDIVVNVNATSNSVGYMVANLNGYIKQSVTGTSPNQVCEFEFAHFSRNFVLDEVIKFKVRLYQTSNKIEFLYGPTFSGMDATPAEVGLKGNNNTDFNSRSVVAPNPWNLSVASTLISDVCDFDPSIGPVNGLSYMWSPVTCSNPTLSISQSNTLSCSGTSVVLTATGATTYSWTNGPATQQYTINPTTSTTYTLTGANGSCTGSLTVTQSVVPYPVVNITQSNTLICKGESVTFTATGASTYSWSTGSTTAQIVVSPTSTTTYTLTGTDGPCQTQTTVVQNVQECVGIADADLKTLNFAVYPNPFSNTLKVKNTNGRELNISISDAIGKIVYTSKVGANDIHLIDTATLNSGLYFITLSDKTNSTTQKIIKE